MDQHVSIYALLLHVRLDAAYCDACVDTYTMLTGDFASLQEYMDPDEQNWQLLEHEGSRQVYSCLLPSYRASVLYECLCFVLSGGSILPKSFCFA